MPLSGEEVRFRTGDPSGEPGTMRHGHHAVLAPLPDRDRGLDCREVESPGRDEREVVITPAVDPRRDGSAQAPGEVLGIPAGQRRFVDIADETAQGGSDVGRLNVLQGSGFANEKRLERVAILHGRVELFDVFGSYA